MTRLKGVFASLMLALTLVACGNVETATRAAPFEDTTLNIAVPDYSIQSFSVTVPKSLKVNEANKYYPRGDIVWRGDPIGDRHQQVKAMFEQGLRQAAPQITGSRPVRVDVLVTRFHGLSEKARYSIGGVHNIKFKMRVVDPVTGQQLGQTKEVQADLDALKGLAAMAAEGRGETQKARVIAHLTHVFTDEFNTATGHINSSSGLFGAVNNL